MYLLDWTGNHFLDPDNILATIKASTESGWNPTTRATRGDPQLIYAIARSFSVEPTSIAVVPGSAAGIDAVLRSYPSAPIVDIIPNFHQARTVASRDRRIYFRVKVGPDSDLETAVEEYCNIGAILIVASPSNPYGFHIPLHKIEALLSKWDGIVLLDEAYADFAPSTAISLTTQYSNLIVSRTFSKAWGLADVRIGFLVGNRFPSRFDSYITCIAPSYTSTFVALRMLEEPSLIRRSISATIKMRGLIFDKLHDFQSIHAHMSQANFLAIHCDDATRVVRDLRMHDIQVKQLSTLKDWPLDWKDGFRLSICPQPVFNHFLGALSEVNVS
ncbi:aminotransferase class I/II-fold pyridoxal phosphate-dependent enzyme [Rhizobium ruizarguesonis]|uniref:aminotransferase class I/II-fold pyridoxal phosphate-dependent enzyme n=1 Tax=Rhizobium ruizarguesonis TaxID=2081791 RepID=UPI001030D3D2|nr:aminotransferase class I/II-fold pyridoxal phosphate-dependent enzyme [Rhizobium ruizarguesonis]TBA92814.1 aminotransferase class I/II-fold pyridoxal phosphate-dependent enzyme [Rhizobium ruizarguesonis]